MSSKHQQSEGQFFDIRPKKRREGIVARLLHGAGVVDLKPTIYKRYRAWVVAVLFLLALTGLVVRHALTKAEVTTFYPANCLGTWVNPERAQGKPESFESSSSITEENTARYGGGAAQIFCGRFVDDGYETKGTIKNVSVAFVWRVGEEAPPVAATSSDASSTAPAPVEQLPLPEGGSGTTTPTSDQSWLPVLKNFLSVVRAQESAPEPAATEPPPAAETPAPVVETPPQDSTTAPTEESAAPDVPPASDQSANVSETLNPSEENSVSSTASSTPLPPPVPPIGSEDPSGSERPAPDEHFLVVKYNTDGEHWVELAKVSPQNWPNFTVTLPVTSWDELRKIQLSIEDIPTSLANIPPVYLDGIVIEAHYDTPPAVLGTESLLQTPVPLPPVQTPVIVLPSSQNALQPVGGGTSFKADEAPVFELNLDALPLPTSTDSIATSSIPLPPPPPPEPASTSSPMSFLRSFFLRIFPWGDFARAQTSAPPDAGLPTATNPVVAKVFDPQNHLTGIAPTSVFLGQSLRVILPQPKREFAPGVYSLKLWVWRDGVIYYSENDFSWGVLVVNFNKSIYVPGNTVHIGFAVLTDRGHTVCDAAINADITSPSGRTYRMSTTNKTITRNATCGPQTVTNQPDYSSIFSPKETGTYRISVTATNDNGTRTITDSFEVQSSPLFDVERFAPTRIYPPATYDVRIAVTANEDWSGQITESMPSSFIVNPEAFAERNFSGAEQTLSWNVNLKKGETIDVRYSFLAPNVSPELYKLGPFRLGNWQEARQWQIAADAAGDIILLWEGTSSDIPSGWTCISCAATDAFYGVMPRASSTYGNASSGVDTVTHIIPSGATATATVAVARAVGTGNTGVTATSTHTYAQTATGSSDIRPPFKNLLFIKAASTTTQLPNGIVGIFNVSATSSLPANWSYYSALNGNYLRGGENTTSTGGSAQHTHSVSITSATSTQILQGGGIAASAVAAVSTHTHTITGTTANASNTPPFAYVVFAQLTATSSLPNGLIAMFDNSSLPTNWNSISTSGSAYAGNFLKGRNSFGVADLTTSTTHAHTSLSTSTNTYAADIKVSTAGSVNFAASHAHTVTLTVNSSTSMPVYRDVILGKLTVTNSAPTVASVSLNHGNPIVLTANATTSIDINFTVTDTDGCTDVFTNGGVTSTAFRSSVGSACSLNNLNCYNVSTSTHNCVSGNSANATATVGIYYFADATDSSSSYSNQTWQVTVIARDAANATGTASSTDVELNTLLAIDVVSSTVSYGTITASSTTGAVNVTSTLRNAGNASSTIKISGTALNSASQSIATSSQHYATSSFTFGGLEQLLTDTLTAVTGFTLTSPTSTGRVQGDIFWGLTVPAGYATGTYSGVNTFSAVFAP